MEQKINIAELLKDCPRGMELYSPLCGKCVFDSLNMGTIICKKQNTQEIAFTSEGYYMLPVFEDCECMIFPSKDQRDWSKFQRSFKDGDILTNDRGSICIYKGPTYHNKKLADYYCGYRAGDHAFIFKKFKDNHFGAIDGFRLATEEEKEKLFQAIKDNGYKWNPETKTLEKLNIPKEEPIKDKGNISDGYHTFNELYEYRLLYNASMFNELAKQGLYDVHKSKKHSDGTIPFGDENWFIVQAELPTGQISNHYEMKDWDLFQVPVKEKANLYDGHTPQDVAKRLRMFLTSDKLIEPKFKVGDKVRRKNNHNLVFTITSIEEDSYGCGANLVLWFDDQDKYELIPNKFDITTLKPFDKVLVRDTDKERWDIHFYERYNNENKVYPYRTLGGMIYKQCIPYEGNEHLIGLVKDCSDYYKTWINEED